MRHHPLFSQLSACAATSLEELGYSPGILPAYRNGQASTLIQRALPNTPWDGVLVKIVMIPVAADGRTIRVVCTPPASAVPVICSAFSGLGLCRSGLTHSPRLRRECAPRSIRDKLWSSLTCLDLELDGQADRVQTVVALNLYPNYHTLIWLCTPFMSGNGEGLLKHSL